MKKCYAYLFLVALFISSQALSCSFPYASYESKINSAESIFIGTVLEGKFVEVKTSNEEPDQSYVEVKIQIHRIIKGKSVPKIATIRTSPSDCGISFSILRTYLIFKSPDINYVYVSDGTSEINRLYEETTAKEIEAFIKKNSAN